MSYISLDLADRSPSKPSPKKQKVTFTVSKGNLSLIRKDKKNTKIWNDLMENPESHKVCMHVFFCFLLDTWQYSVCMPVCPSVCPSLNFLKIGLLFPDIVHDDSWPWYLVTDETRLLKKIWRPKSRPNRPKLGPKLGFLPFS